MTLNFTLNPLYMHSEAEWQIDVCFSDTWLPEGLMLEDLLFLDVASSLSHFTDYPSLFSALYYLHLCRLTQ